MGKRIVLNSGSYLGDFLGELGITPYRLAKEIGISQPQIAKILSGANRITADTAIRLAKFFDTTVEYWLNIQQVCDIEKAETEFEESRIVIRKYSDIVPAGCFA